MGPHPYGRGNISVSSSLMYSLVASMGPHPYGRGNISVSSSLMYSLVASMGPHPYGRGNQCIDVRIGGSCMLLQWGRTLTGAGICTRSCAIPRSDKLQWGRTLTGAGIRLICKGAVIQILSFNGAAPLRARELILLDVAEFVCEALQWGRTLTGAGICTHSTTDRITDQASMGPHPYGRGNFDSIAVSLAAMSASMGPHPYGRGNNLQRQSRADQCKASMGPHPYGRGNLAAMHVVFPARLCFNGAAPLRAREFGPYATRPAVVGLLQWGRTLTGAGMIWACTIRPAHSMLQWGRTLTGAGIFLFFLI